MDIVVFFLFAAYIVLMLWLGFRILTKAGFVGEMILLMLNPLINIIMLWVFAFSKWPNLQESVGQDFNKSVKLQINHTDENKINIRWVLFSFQGRLSRQPFLLFNGAVILIGWLIFVILGSGEEAQQTLSFYIFLLLWPMQAITVKRWHDRDKSGMWILINLVPVIGQLWSLVEAGFLPGTEGENRFGANPSAFCYET